MGGYSDQPAKVAFGLVVPLVLGGVAVGLAEWRVPPPNLTEALTASLALLAILHVPEVVDVVTPNRRDRSQKPPAKSVRWFIGVWAFIAILAILAHIVTKNADDTVDGSRKVAAFDATVELQPEPIQITAKSADANSHSGSTDVARVVIERLDSDLEPGRTHRVVVSFETTEPDFGWLVRELLRHLAVGLTVASLGWWVSSRWVLDLINAPDPPALPSRRLCAGTLHLFVFPGLVVVPTVIWWDSCFDQWWKGTIAALVAIFAWQFVRSESRLSEGKLSLGLRISAVRKDSAEHGEPTVRQLLLRALLLGAVAALPMGVVTSLFDARLENTSDGLPPVWVVVLSALPVLDG